MGTRYLMNGFSGVWNESQSRDEPTVAFQIENGRGRFLFMMFFDPEDGETRDKLLVFLQNTQYMLRLKLYGSHYRGEFQLFLEDWQVEKIKRELQLAGRGGPAFDMERFMQSMNASIPQSMPLAAKIKLLRENRNAYQTELAKILDFHDRTELVGEMPLPPEKKPREKTLRKLYLYSTRSPEDVAIYIGELKRRNHTLRWRAPTSQH